MVLRAWLAGAVVVVAAATAPAGTQAQAVTCASVAAYPGDAAPKPSIARWMAYGASRVGLPRELPVMAALVESNLTNQPVGDGDRAGYFQTRVGIWNTGEYAGFPDNPPLQLKWFLDQAAKVRAQRIAAGLPDPAADEARWGGWIADTLLAPDARRGAYQPRLAEARALAGAPCTEPAPGEPEPPSPFMPLAPPSPFMPPAPRADTAPPALAVAGSPRQRALRAGAIVLRARCPAEACALAATASITLPRARRAPRIALRARPLAAAQLRRLRFVPSTALRRRIGAALRERGSVKVTVRVTASDAAGNRAVVTRTVRITG